MLKVISYSLFGNDPIYVQGLFNNIKLAKKFYPGWEMWIYVDDSVDADVLDRLKYTGARIVKVHPEMKNVGRSGAFWRFLALAEADITLIRDLDCKITAREVRMVEDWLKSDKDIHTIRDVGWYTTTMQAGQTGFKKKVPEIEQLIKAFPNKEKYGADEKFLHQYFWDPKKVYQHDNFKHYEGCYEMPFLDNELPVGLKASKSFDITVLMYADSNMKDVAMLGSTSVREYCDRHGYHFCQEGLVYPTDIRHPSWHKLLAIKQKMHTSDWLVCVDADVIAVNHTIPLELSLQSMLHSNKVIGVSQDTNGMCCGLIAVQTHAQEAQQILDTWWNVGDVKDDSVYGLGPKWEQNALKALCNNFPRISSKVGILDPDPMHTYAHQLNPKTIFTHFPCADNKTRIERMLAINSTAKR